MRRATTFAIVALLLYAVVIAAYATIPVFADAKDGVTTNFDPALNAQPIGGCGFLENFDIVMPPVLPPNWTAINAINPDGIFWQTSDSGDPSPPAESLPNAAWINDPDTVSDKYLDSPPLVINPNARILIFSNNYPLDDGFRNASLSFSNNYALDDGFDGGVLEVSVDGGPFQDILAAGGSFDTGGYNGTISTCCGNPLAGRPAWTGDSGGFILTAVDLAAFFGHSIVLRWRMASDSSGSGDGWRVDDIAIGCERSTPTPTPFPTPSITPTPSATPTATPTPTPPFGTPTPPPPTPTPTVPEVCGVDHPVCEPFFFPPPTDFDVGVSCPVDGCKPAGFTVNDVPANSCTVSEKTATFHFNTSPAVPGLNTMHLDSGVVFCCLRPVNGFDCTFDYITPTPSPTPTATPRATPRPRPTPHPRPTP
jgi:hypothetical protein